MAGCFWIPAVTTAAVGVIWRIVVIALKLGGITNECGVYRFFDFFALAQTPPN